MLRISKLADYATVIMHRLAVKPGDVLSASEIAQRVHLSKPTVSKILKILSDADLVTSIRGAGGGYKLAQMPADITIARVITAVEGQPALTECAQTSQLCVQDSVCAIKHNWQVINRFILEALENLTLADMGKPLSFYPAGKITNAGGSC
jgi:FeS assembly SUF system regulator